MRLFRVILPFSLLIPFGACEQDASSPVDVRGTLPLLHAASIAPQIVNTDTINVGAERKPTDQLSIPIQLLATASPNSSVRASFRVIATDASIGAADLKDDGIFPDVTANDSVYSGIANITIQRSLIGLVNVQFVAHASNGDESIHSNLPLSIVRLNRAPVLSDLQAPSVVEPATEPTFRVTVRVSDPDGAADIKSVFRLTPSGKVFPLNDAQANGDLTAGDGIYTETVSVQPAPSPGFYTFQFRAVDRSGDSSNVLTKTIEIR